MKCGICALCRESAKVALADTVDWLTEGGGDVAVSGCCVIFSMLSVKY